jgi:hypothetical protein
LNLVGKGNRNMAKLKIEWLALDKIKPYPNNPRINADAVDAVAASIAEFGFKVPILVDKSLVIIAGHTRRLAAIKLKLSEVPVIVATDLSPAKVKALRIADNATSDRSEWDMDLLTAELASLEESKYDLDLLGFARGSRPSLLPPEIRRLPIKRPPALSWFLVGIPSVRIGDIQEHIDRIAKVDGTIIKSTVTDALKTN